MQTTLGRFKTDLKALTPLETKWGIRYLLFMDIISSGFGIANKSSKKRMLISMWMMVKVIRMVWHWVASVTKIRMVTARSHRPIVPLLVILFLIISMDIFLDCIIFYFIYICIR